MTFKERHLLEENSFWRTALPLAGVAGGAYLGHEIADDFVGGAKEQMQSELGPKGIITALTGEHKVGTPEEEFKKLVTLNGGSVKDIGRSIGHAGLHDKSLLDKAGMQIDPEKMKGLEQKFGAAGLAGGAALGGLAGLAVRPRR